ncbi:BON domain-containing protein [Rickettsiales endosymbiont of Peranema trichophorum]|uniref:BON domain-containing protein n=1 Tax=Rickettsiales endosymbiont of Peranema trichophorum TaxID=2486577 RepID=UPI00102365FA|nr:BON domain-containing protein [Rickettsiales endosymbiont of Peranema trichophorum]RZI47319.1 BON domain-containing protein [Rickettsiales endosymbiont of Peranema trichophorum]
MIKRVLPIVILLSYLVSGCLPLAIVTTGEIGTSLAEERSFGNIMDDKGILLKIKNAFAQKHFGDLFTKVSVHVYEGRVLLTGNVLTKHDSLEAAKIVWSIRGVKEVINEIEVGQKDFKAKALDSFIMTSIKSKLLMQKDVRSLNYTVDVNNGVVYLLGIAQSNSELDTVLEIARRTKGVKKVVSHVIFVTDPRRIAPPGDAAHPRPVK